MESLVTIYHNYYILFFQEFLITYKQKNMTVLNVCAMLELVVTEEETVPYIPLTTIIGKKQVN